MVAASLTCVFFIVSFLSAINFLFISRTEIQVIEKEILCMAQTTAPPGGLPLGEFRKDTPPGWCPGDPTYSLKLYMERIRMWYRTFEGPDEMVGPGRPFDSRPTARKGSGNSPLFAPGGPSWQLRCRRRRVGSAVSGRSSRPYEPQHRLAGSNTFRSSSPHERIERSVR